LSSALRWLAIALALSACESAGPALIERDQVNYTSALLEAEKRQLLLNIVRLRFGDIPSVVRVDQIVAGYERRVLGTIGSSLATDFDITDDFAVRAEGSLADRPTYTLKPLQGTDYARFMLRPIPPRELVGLIASGAQLHAALGLSVERINRIPNDDLLSSPEAATGRFWRVVALLQTLRNEGLLQIDFEPAGDTERVYISFVHGEGAPQDERAAGLIQLLDLDPTAERYEVVLAVAPRDRQQIAIWTRSLIEILTDVSAGIDDTEAGPIPRLLGLGQPTEGSAAALRINVAGGPIAPDDTFVSVRFNGQWYWITDDDVWAKRAFSTLLLLTTILERGEGTTGTVLTIPAN